MERKGFNYVASVLCSWPQLEAGDMKKGRKVQRLVLLWGSLLRGRNKHHRKGSRVQPLSKTDKGSSSDDAVCSLYTQNVCPCPTSWCV